jgi:hypothetical protein
MEEIKMKKDCNEVNEVNKGAVERNVLTIKKGDIPVLENLLNHLRNIVLPRDIQCTLVDFFVKQFRSEYEIYHTIRNDICKKYASKDEKGIYIMTKSVINNQLVDEYTFEGENKENYEREMENFMKEEIRFTFSPFTRDKLKDSKLIFFIEEQLIYFGFMI